MRSQVTWGHALWLGNYKPPDNATQASLSIFTPSTVFFNIEKAWMYGYLFKHSVLYL